MVTRFRDRRDAGRQLASMLSPWKSARSLVLALPRGGVPVGYEVARMLGVDFDILVVRKVGVPGEEELAMGAVASGGVVVRNEKVISWVGIPQQVFDEAVLRESSEVVRRERLFRGTRPALEVAGRTVILVDDGLATGSTMRVALRSLRQKSPKRIVVAVPIASSEACADVAAEADSMVCALRPESLFAVGQGYDDFGQTTDDEVRDLLARAAEERGAREHKAGERPIEQSDQA